MEGNNEVKINCKDEITSGDVHRLREKINGEDAVYVDVTNALVCNTASSDLKHAEIFITLPSKHYTLWAGEKTNKFAVFRDMDGTVKSVRKASGWWLWLKETTKNVFNWVTENVPMRPLLLMLIGGVSAAIKWK